MLDGASHEPQRKTRSGSEKRERGIVNTFRSTRDERAKIASDAAALGFTVGSYIRWLALERPQTRPVRRPLPAEMLLRQIKSEAGRVDGNLAQFLKLANRGEPVPQSEIADAARAVRDFYLDATEKLKDA
jgi:hypothetical protein